ncbi:MAG: 50S ribosomal protein L31e [Candidatus Thermoplasmatota archaeon]|nr:50S ribosomal protein L31e [Candidatus Thermoplasmatota archaeon]MCL5665776.1 50S ribosomal protein L31e [Candidatus Thermoplasmatota archaeon]
MVESEVTDELLYVIPLRRARLSSRSRRADTAISAVRKFVSRNSKVPPEDVWIDPKISEKIWSRGKRNIPMRLNVKVIKLKDGSAEVIMP